MSKQQRTEPSQPQVRPSGWFLMAGLLSFPVAAAFVAVVASRLTVLDYRSIPVLVANHLITLGWGTMVALGSLNQLLPAAAGAPSTLDRAAALQFAFYAPGIILLTFGLWAHTLELMIVGSISILAAIGLFLASAFVVLRHRTRRLPTLGYIGAALAGLGYTVSWGVLFVLNWRFAFWNFLLTPGGLIVHVTLGLIAWFALLIMGISYYLLPRFSGHSVRGLHEREVLLGTLLGVFLVIIGTFSSARLVRGGLFVIALCGLLYTADLYGMLRLWHPRSKDITRLHWQVLAVLSALLTLGLAAGAAGLLPGDSRRWIIAGVVLFLLGWVTLAITGQVYKVTPFLMWYYRFGRGLSALEVPQLEAPYWPPGALATIILVGSGGPLISLGVVLRIPQLGLVGGLLFLSGATLFSYLLGYSWLPKLRKP